MSKMKKLISVLLVLVMLLGIINISSVISFAQTSPDGKFDYTVSGTNATFVKYNKIDDTGNYTIPSKIGNYTITEIEGFAFSQCQFTTITIPNSVLIVGDGIFEKCSRLTTVNIGAGVKKFGTNVFSETPRLAKINVSPSNKYFSSDSTGIMYSKDETVIYAYPVANESTSFTVPNKVKSIEHYAFDGANNLKTLTVGTGLTSISDLAFIGARNIESINILGAVTSIGNNAFGNINKLKTINIPDTVTYIGKEAFQDDNELKSLLIPASVNYIGVDAFEATASDFLVYCYSGSYAVTYCETYNIEYELIDSVLSSLIITSPPAKTNYCLDEELDPTGLIVSALYSNGISRTVTGYKLSDFDSSTKGVKAITVSFTDSGITRSASFTVSVGNHNWQFDSYVEGSEPTCEEGGLAKYVCTICSASKTEEVSALGHDPVDDIFMEPDCTNPGYKNVMCSRCYEVLEEDVEIAPLGHISDNYTKYKPATCTEGGEMAGTCTRCGVVFDDILAPLGHNYVNQVIEPSCEEKGANFVVCSRCNEVTSAVFTEALGHDYVPTVKEPTCTEQGYTTYVCANCSNTYIDDYIPASSHLFDIKRVEPTCTDEGYTYYKCNVCSYAYYGNFTRALGHNYSTQVTVNPTSTKIGYTRSTCSRCNYIWYTDIKDRLGPSSVSATCASYVEIGKKIKISTSLTPSGIVDRVLFKSSNTKVATVSASGVVTGKSIGTVKIKCYLSNGKYTTVTVKVKTPSTQIKSLITVAKGRLKVNWNQVNAANGYCVQYSRYSSFKKGVTTKYISGKSNTSLTFKKLASGKRYYVRVAAYKTVNGSRSLSVWSKIKSVKVK